MAERSDFGSYLRELRIENGYTQSGLAEAVDIDNSYLSHIENNNRRPSPPLLKKIARFLETDYRDLARRAGLLEEKESRPYREEPDESETDLEAIEDTETLRKLIRTIEQGNGVSSSLYDGESPDRRSVPIYDKVPAGLFDEANVVEEYEDLEELVLAEEELNYDPDAFALRVRGDSMIDAGIYEDDVVVVSPRAEVEDGDIAVVSYEGKETTMKKVFFEEETVILQPCNSAYKPMTLPRNNKLSIMGKVILVRRRL